MNCKKCGDKGMVFRVVELDASSTNTTAAQLEVVTCECCGGWSSEGKPCENCQAGRRVIEWVNEEDYPAAIARYMDAAKGS